jgi:hypothetical protein
MSSVHDHSNYTLIISQALYLLLVSFDIYVHKIILPWISLIFHYYVEQVKNSFAMKKSFK